MFNISHSTTLQGSGKTAGNVGVGMSKLEQIVMIYFLLPMRGMISRCNRRGEQNLCDATAAANGWTRADLDQTDLCSQVDTAIWNHLP